MNRACLAYLLVLLFTSGCSLTKNLGEDEYVYMGSNISVEDGQEASSVTNFDHIIKEIPPDGTQTGVGNILLGLHNVYDETRDQGFKHWVKNKLGNAPVIYEAEIADRTIAKLKYFLNGKGFFAHEVSCDSIRDGRKVTLGCDVSLGERYKLDSLIFPVDSTYVALKLDEELQRAIIREGSYYDRDRLDYERVRLASMAGDLGFADFGSDNIHYFVDTTAGNHQVDLYTRVIAPTDSTFHTRYVLDTIRIYPNYTIDKPLSKDLKRKTIDSTMYILESEHYLDHGLMDRLILQNPGTFYNRSEEKKSINRLLDLGVFRFINVNNLPNPKKGQGHFVQEIFLTPERMQNISGEIELNNRSGNFLGVGASVNYQHRNIFKHAERLNFSLGGQVETQFGDGVTFINSSDLYTTLEIAFPRFITPFFTIREGRNYIPRTLLRTNYSYQRRSLYYTLQSITARFGYKWRENSKTTHELYPISLNNVTVFNKSDEFQALLDMDARLATSFENVLITGLQYNLTFSSQANKTDLQYRYLRAELETSGNLFNLFGQGTIENPSGIGGSNFAQFAKMTLDYRRYLDAGSTSIAGRILLGGGLAYGNSAELPYIKQYVIGGSSSIRAFRLRGLGPGSYYVDPTDLDEFATQFVDQTGDLKLEMNVEWRFPIFRFLKGALFVDAGNVWLINNSDRPEGNFEFDRFYREIAVGSGLGLRLDFGFFLIRMDMAFPLRAPTLNDDFEWRFSGINPLERDWRRDNLRFNLGIGYPF